MVRLFYDQVNCSMTCSASDLFCKSAFLPPNTTNSRGPQEQARFLAFQRAAEPLSTYFCASADFVHSPAICRVVTLSRFQTLVMATQRIKAASCDSL